LRLHRAGVEPRNVENCSEDGFHRFQRGIDVLHELLVGIAKPLDQRRRIEPRSVERLQDVMAGSGEKAGLADIGFLGGQLRLLQFRLTRVSSAVRSLTRCSSVSLACLSAMSAATRSVMSA
jgi:hypothetical protein